MKARTLWWALSYICQKYTMAPGTQWQAPVNISEANKQIRKILFSHLNMPRCVLGIREKPIVVISLRGINT